MLKQDVKTLPIDHWLLGQWASHTLIKQAQELLDGVISWEWEAPLLRGQVRDELHPKQIRTPVLNLRSTAFVKNSCQCARAAQGYVCVHALMIALCALEAKAKLPEKKPTKKLVKIASSEALPKLRSIVVANDRGHPLSFVVLLPPNLKSACQTISLKIEAFVQGSFLPLENLSRRQAYRMSPEHYQVALLLENWCQGQLYSLLQLRPEQLAELLELLKGEDCVFWSQSRLEAIPWLNGKLLGVPDLSKAPKLERSLVPQPARKVFAEPTAEIMTIDGSLDVLRAKVHAPENHPELVRWLKDEGLGLEPSNRCFWLRDRHKVLNFLAHNLKRLKSDYPGCISDHLQAHLDTLQMTQLQAFSHEENGQVHLQLRLEAGKVDAVALRKALGSGCFYVQDAQQYYLIDPKELHVLRKAQQGLSGDPTQAVSPLYERILNPAQLTDACLLLEPLSEHWQSSESWQQQGQALRHIDALGLPALGPQLMTTLRPYQKLGIAWLWHLYKHGLGGILADEMGLGKTIQALGVMEALFLENPQAPPVLVVCPASLTENWRRETLRFTQGLAHCIHHGNQRLADAQQVLAQRVIITSYGTLARDQALFSKIPFSLIIADEAQHIKNRNTQNAQALRTLKAQSRFVLTGTPLENSVEDLHALFEFLMPGYLASPATPSQARENRQWYDVRQREQAAPYVLRRSKAQVTPELPKKIEQTLFCSFEPKQEALYNAVLAKTRKEIFDLEMAGASHGHVYMAALTQLLRLRQICAEPRLLDPSLSAQDSAKFRILKELIEEAQDDGHRLLVFSQFASLLRILAQDFDKSGLRYTYLDGQTVNRQAVCDTFNNDPEIPVFLISLKAGGVGLNLASANTVVFCDPWWNPAVEAQAVDRAHRIGQTRTVTSIKLIAANTVEEKIVELQRQKASLLEDLFSSSEQANAKLALEGVKKLLKERS